MRQEDATLVGKTVNLGDGAGFTRFGITSKNCVTPPDFFTTDAHTALAMAIEIYRAKYWNPMHGDSITPDEVAASIFSFAVNGGETYEIELAQRAVGVTADGNIGPASIAAFGEPGAGAKIRAAQAAHYNAIYASNPAHYEQWIRGWLNRVGRIYPNL